MENGQRLLEFYNKFIPELKTAFVDLELEIINKFLIDENCSEILSDLKTKLVLG